MNNSSPDEKIEILLKKLNTLEIGIQEERKVRMRLEDEVNTYHNIKIPYLEKQLEENESLCQAVFIDKLKVEKELIELINKVK
jgi:hypothetical protein